MWVKTCPVPKKPGLIDPSLVRPISVMSQLYRLWARVQCRHVIQHLSQKITPEITGFLPSRGPYDAIYEFQWLLEQAHNGQGHRSGISIDLLKCFNTIDREAAQSTMLHVGIPRTLVNQWYTSLQEVTRSWTLGPLIGPILHTSRGCPEGDPLSVLVMVLISTCWIAYIHRHTDDVTMGAYADNWGWMAKHPQAHASVLRHTSSFVGAYTMTIDWKKSWIWMTHQSHLPPLKKALRDLLGPNAVASLMQAMDLGGQLTYRGPPKLGKVSQRLSEAERRLRQLQHMPHDARSKSMLVTMGIYPQVFYASAIIPIGRQHTDKLRSSIADAILGPSVSRNSAIAIQCLPKLQDPELVLTQNAIDMAHRFLHRCTPKDAQLFLRIASQHSGISYECKGPAGCLKFYLSRMGWVIDKLGNIQVTAFLRLNLFTTSRQCWRRLLQKEWETQLLPRFSDRTALKGLPPINKLDTTAVMRQFPRQDWKTLLNEISAAYQTAAQQAVWDTSTSPNCSNCQVLDTREHRLFHCTLVEDIRAQYPLTFQWMQNEGTYWHELPVIHTHSQAEWLHLCNWTHTEPDIQPGLYQAVHAVDMQGAPLSFYTDGSCQFPAHPNESYSTYSVIIDTATDDAEREQHAKHYATGQHMPCTLCSLAVARTPGEQRIHRAELYAIVYICERFQNTIVHTDSAVTLAAIRRCQNTSNPDTLHDMEDLDLVLRLWVTLHTGNRQFLKVKAHAEEDSQVPWLTLYHRLGNKRANDVAITANEFLLAPLVQEMQDMHKDLAAQRHHLAQLLRYHLEVIRRHAELKFIKQQEEATTLPEQALPTRQAVFHKLCQYQADPCWSRVAPQVQELRHCTWGPTLTAKLQDWCNQIRWPTNRTDDEIQNAGLTWIEMVLSFMIFARCFLPVKRPGQEGVMMLTPIQSFAALKAYDVKLSELANLFAIFCKQLQDLQDTPIFPEVERGLVRSLYIQGAAFFSSGFRIRAVVPFQTEVLSSLQPYLLRHRGRAFVDIPEFPIEPDEAMFLQVKSELRQSWDSRTAMTHKAARRIRDWLKNPQQQLRFAPMTG